MSREIAQIAGQVYAHAHAHSLFSVLQSSAAALARDPDTAFPASHDPHSRHVRLRAFTLLVLAFNNCHRVWTIPTRSPLLPSLGSAGDSLYPQSYLRDGSGTVDRSGMGLTNKWSRSRHISTDYRM